MAIFSNTKLQRKKPHSNAPGIKNDGSTAFKRFKYVSEEEECRWSLPSDMVNYPNKKFPDKDVREPILLKLPKTDNLYSVKKLDDSLVEFLKQKKNK